MGVIRKHADSMYKLGHAIPPRPSCVYPASAKKPLGAWFAGSPDGTAAVRKCVNAPDVSLAYYMMFGECSWRVAAGATQPHGWLHQGAWWL